MVARPFNPLCPSCQRKLAPVDQMRSATQVLQRTCRGCGDRWQLVVHVREFRGNAGFINTIEFTFIPKVQGVAR